MDPIASTETATAKSEPDPTLPNMADLGVSDKILTGGAIAPKLENATLKYVSLL